jgi:predicted DNA-binding protein (MmcQ/YjbR family)
VVTKKNDKRAAAEAELRTYALSLPDATEEFPWGDRVIKVKKKVFVFLGRQEPDPTAEFGLSVKLPQSGMMALALPFASPTGYGLGKAGWVTARFAPGVALPLPMLRAWIEESYRAVAPKKLLAALGDPAKAPRSKRSG